MSNMSKKPKPRLLLWQLTDEVAQHIEKQRRQNYYRPSVGLAIFCVLARKFDVITTNGESIHRRVDQCLKRRHKAGKIRPQLMLGV